MREVFEDWRIAKVTPVFRKQDLENNMSVSLVSIPGKVMEQFIPNGNP